MPPGSFSEVDGGWGVCLRRPFQNLSHPPKSRLHMSRVLKFVSLLASSAFAYSASAAEEAGVSPTASRLLDFGNGWAVTNSMATGWAVSALLIILVLWVIGKPTLLPSKGQ